MTLTARPELAPAILRIGLENEPVLVIDDVAQDPDALVDCAARETTFTTPTAGRNFYPGLLAPAPLTYVETVARVLDPHIRQAFALGDVYLGRAVCNFSLATLAPGQLNLAQRLPHVDTVDPLQFAILHYLCGPQWGGTAFYRHRSTGFETLSPERVEAYQTALDAEIGRSPPAAAYVAGDTPLHVRTGGVDAAWNRALVYRSRLLHSGQIAANAPLSADPRLGRLTANIFLTYRPRRNA